MRAGSSLLDPTNKEHWDQIQRTEGGTAHLLRNFEDYANTLAQNVRKTYLKPFTIVTDNMSGCKFCQRPVKDNYVYFILGLFFLQSWPWTTWMSLTQRGPHCLGLKTSARRTPKNSDPMCSFLSSISELRVTKVVSELLFFFVNVLKKHSNLIFN